MTSFTPNFGLPYPSATDAPCDFAEQWCDFTAAVTGVLDTFESAVARTVPAIPVAQMWITTPVTVDNGQFVPFDTVTTNTVSWIDFDADRTSITVNRAGRFVVTGSVTVANSGVVNSTFTMNINTLTDFGLDRGTFTIGMCASQLVATSTVTQYQMTVFGTAAGTVQIELGSMSVYWHADGATP